MEISEENTAYFMDYPDSSGVELAKKQEKRHSILLCQTF